MKPRGVLRFLFLTCSVVQVLLACGIETIPYLIPPEPKTPLPPDKLRFAASSQHDQTEFQGFELYYKFYTLSEEIEVAVSSHLSLEPAGFFRINSEDDTRDNIDKPLIKIHLGDRGKDYTVTIDFSDEPKITLDFLEPVVTDTNINIRRGAYEGDDFLLQPFKNFLDVDIDDFDLDDNVQRELMDITSAYVKLAIYVLSYGEGLYFNQIHSAPLYLGDIDMTIQL